MTIEPRHLTREDLRSRTWEHLVEEMTARVEALRVENDSFSDHETTTKRRGRIQELKDWIALASQAQSRDTAPNYGAMSFQPTRAN